MEIKKFKIEDSNFMFVCNTYSTSQSWGHKATLFENDIQIGENTIRYYNRTWEMYQYQSVMQGAVSKLKEKAQKRVENNYRTEHEIKRITKKQKEELDNLYYSDNEIKKLNALYREL